MNERYFLITHRIRDGEAEYLTHTTVEITDPDFDPDDVARDFLLVFWGDTPDEKRGTAEDPRWESDINAYWDPEMVRLVEAYSVKPITQEEYKVLNRLFVACDITAETVGRRFSLRDKKND